MGKVATPEPEGFDELWSLWRDHARKTDGRGKARPTYRKWLLEGAEPADIIDGARWHIRSMKQDERPFIQLLSVYLNSEKWKDECDRERDYQRDFLRCLARRQGVPATNVIQITEAPKASDADRAAHVENLRDRYAIMR